MNRFIAVLCGCVLAALASALTPAQAATKQVVIENETRDVIRAGDALCVTGNVGDNLLKSVELRVDRRRVDQTPEVGNYKLIWQTLGRSTGLHVAEVWLMRLTGQKKAKKIWVEVVEKQPLSVVSPKPEAEVLGATAVRFTTSIKCRNIEAQCWLNGKLVTPSPAKEPVWDVKDTPPGTYTLQIKTTSDRGLMVSDPVKVTVPARVTLEKPAAGAKIVVDTASRTVELAARAHPQLSAASCEFLCDGKTVATAKPSGTSATWAVTDLAAGEHTIVARATDKSGYVYDSLPSRISVTNALIEKKQADENALKLAEAAALKKAEEEVIDKLEEEARQTLAQMTSSRDQQPSTAPRGIFYDWVAKRRAESAEQWRIFAAARAFDKTVMDGAFEYIDYQEEHRWTGGPAPLGTVSGRVTYYSEIYQMTLPDEGADVWLVYPHIDIPDKWFVFSPNLMTLICSFSEMRNYRVTVPVIRHGMVYPNGNFLLDFVQAGPYTLIIRSKHTRGLFIGCVTPRDMFGRIFCKTIDVGEGSGATVSHDFGVTAY